MALTLFDDRGCSLDQQRFTWRDMVQTPISKPDDDAYPRVRIILMNGLEVEALRFSHTCAIPTIATVPTPCPSRTR
ncbi:hypothetical protein [Aquabacterium sp. A7-Y]|uniref:hypothetical protein n=1 Tax=Aquabacterium sp. A7-Y TaxID=1349605 RepID=UPI002AC83D7D|nr:hypothetical protein [Aquabacterium sp. A7-Y]